MSHWIIAIKPPLIYLFSFNTHFFFTSASACAEIDSKQFNVFPSSRLNNELLLIFTHNSYPSILQAVAVVLIIMLSTDDDELA
jgi:hypothetical protein